MLMILLLMYNPEEKLQYLLEVLTEVDEGREAEEI